MPDTGSDSTYNANGTRRGVSLLLLPATSAVRLVPAWAVLCGALAAHTKRWPIPFTSNPHAWMALALAVFIVQILWSTGQELLIESNHPSMRPAQTRFGRKRPRLPYTTPWSPLGRLGRRWRTMPLEGHAKLTLVLVPLLITILSALIGWQMLLLSLSAAALTLIEWHVARREPRHASSALEAGTLVGLGWLAGHSVFAPLTWASLTVACCSAIAYQGALVLERGDVSPDAPPARKDGRLPWALTLLYSGQGAALILLVVLERPFAAALLGMLLAPQWLLLPLLDTKGSRPYIRRAISFVMGAMLVTGWAVSA